MVRVFLLPVILVIFFYTGNAQEKEKMAERWAISFSPGTAPLPGHPFSFQPGVEFYFGRRFSLFNEVSLQTGKNRDVNSSALNKKYFKYKAELRVYVGKTKKASTPYFGLQFTAAKRKFDVNSTERYYETFQDDSIYIYDKATITSPYKTGTLQFGTIIKVYKSFYFDIAGGYGFKFTNTKYTSVVNQKKISNVGIFNPKPLSSYRYSGKRTSSQINLALRILYQF